MELMWVWIQMFIMISAIGMVLEEFFKKHPDFAQWGWGKWLLVVVAIVMIGHNWGCRDVMRRFNRSDDDPYAWDGRNVD